MAYIIIVDDDLEIAEASQRILQKNGHTADIYTDIEIAFAAIKSKKPDLIILDVMFPENPSAGFDFARRIAKEVKQARILILSAVNAHYSYNFSAKDIDPEWMPVTDFMEKPVEVEKLTNAVNKILAAG